MLSWVKKLICKFCDKPSTKTAILVPDLSDIVSNIKSFPLVNPNDILSNLGYEDIQADNEYYALPKKQWIRLLSRVYNEINSKVHYVLESFDCDDYALIYCSLSQLFYFLNVEDYSIKHQIAIGVGWSDAHAYNIIIDDKENVWIYEPQLNKIISDILNPPNSIYKTKKIMFLG